MHKAVETTWDIAINIGVKCNLLPISRKANIRYISSPFDNLDSVDGFAEMGDLITNRFKDYFDFSQWDLRNDCADNSNKIRAKIAWNRNYPDLYYPHFNQKWLKDVDNDELENSIADPDGKLSFAWEGLSEIDMRRQ